jgi:long-chain fatty acid transport protein
LSNLILTPQPPHGYGLGRLSANVDVFQIAPTVACELDENWSIGVAPTLTIGRIFASPLFLGPLDDSNGDGSPTYATGVGTRYIWGGGFQVGAYYTNPNGWHFGASLKSPQWMEPFRFKSEDELGRPTTVKFDLDYPLIASLGLSYSGFEKWIVAVDFRYFDYANTPGFEEGGFNADGSLRGFGWESIGSMAIGVQRQVSDRFFIRGGYCLNGNPITAESAVYNVASPLLVKHTLHAGVSYVFAENWIMALGYGHAFQNDATGPIKTAAGTVPFSWVGSKASADEVSLGVTKRF